MKVEFRHDTRYAEKPGELPVLDEIVIIDGKTSIHAEMMSDTQCWMGLVLSDGRRIRVVWGVWKGKLLMSAEDEGAA